MPQSVEDSFLNRYSVYGLILATNVEIPGLDAEVVSPEHPADIRIVLGSIPHRMQEFMAETATVHFVEPAEDANAPAHLHVTTSARGRYYHFVYAEGAEFLLDTQESLVWSAWKEDTTLDVACLYLMGPVLGFMLRSRGTTCLHASSILVDGDAMAITGFSGAGKSTLAAAFATEGFSIMTDDILPLANIDGRTYAHPGYSRLRLFPNSFRNLRGLPDDLPKLAPDWDKCYLDLRAHNFKQHKSPAPLKAIYIIDWNSNERDIPVITALPSALAVSKLAPHTYRSELLNKAMRRQEFQFLSAIARGVSIRRFCPVKKISAIPQLCEMLLKDFASVNLHAKSEAAV
jgi:hypothetical protein